MFLLDIFDGKWYIGRRVFHFRLGGIQKAVTITKDNYLHIFFDRDHLINIIEMYHCAIQEDEYEIDIISHELKPMIP